MPSSSSTRPSISAGPANQQETYAPCHSATTVKDSPPSSSTRPTTSSSSSRPSGSATDTRKYGSICIPAGPGSWRLAGRRSGHSGELTNWAATQVGRSCRMADVHLADRCSVDGMFIRKMLHRERNEFTASDVRDRRLRRGVRAVILDSALSSCLRAVGVSRGRPSARQSRRRLEVVQRETADVDRAGNEDVTNEDKSERRLSGGELFAEVLKMKSSRHRFRPAVCHAGCATAYL